MYGSAAAEECERRAEANCQKELSRILEYCNRFLGQKGGECRYSLFDECKRVYGSLWVLRRQQLLSTSW